MIIQSYCKPKLVFITVYYHQVNADSLYLYVCERDADGGPLVTVANVYKLSLPNYRVKTSCRPLRYRRLIAATLIDGISSWRLLSLYRTGQRCQTFSNRTTTYRPSCFYLQLVYWSCSGLSLFRHLDTEIEFIVLKTPFSVKRFTSNNPRVFIFSVSLSVCLSSAVFFLLLAEQPFV